jgi:hypothetical protein
MKYHNLSGRKSTQIRITSITMTMILITMTIALGPLNLLQINSANAQNQASPNGSQLTQGPNSNQMNNAANPTSSQISSASESGGTKGTSNLNGSISILSPIINGFKSLMHVSLNDAISTAQNSLGSNSTTVAAFIHPNKGFIVYDIFALDANNNIHKIIVDPGNGRILSSEQISIIDMMMLVHGGGMSMGPNMDKGMMMNHGGGMSMGPGMDKGMMMGSDMMMNHDGGMNQGW